MPVATALGVQYIMHCFVSFLVNEKGGRSEEVSLYFPVSTEDSFLNQSCSINHLSETEEHIHHKKPIFCQFICYYQRCVSSYILQAGVLGILFSIYEATLCIKEINNDIH